MNMIGIVEKISRENQTILEENSGDMGIAQESQAHWEKKDASFATSYRLWAEIYLNRKAAEIDEIPWKIWTNSTFFNLFSAQLELKHFPFLFRRNSRNNPPNIVPEWSKTANEWSRVILFTEKPAIFSSENILFTMKNMLL